MRHAAIYFAFVMGSACAPSSGARDLGPDALDVALSAPQGASVSQTVSLVGASLDVELLVTAADEAWLSYEVVERGDVPALEVTADSSGMSQGEYSATLDISASGYKPAQLPVMFTVTPPELRFDVSSINVHLDALNTLDRDIVLTSTLPLAPAAITMESDASWMTVAPPGADGTVAMRLDPGGLSLAPYSGTLRASQFGFVDAVLSVSMTVVDCTSTVELNIQSSSRLDVGWTGRGFDGVVPAARLTFKLTCPAATPCGEECTLTSLLDNSVLGASTSRRCSLDTSVTCTQDAECGLGTCELFLPPMTMSAIAGGGNGCVVPYFSGDVTGGFNTVSSEGSVDPLNLVATVFQSTVCAYCVGGTCDGGANDGAACVVHGTTVWGDTSWDCPAKTTPDYTSPLHLPAMTKNADSTWTLSADHPGCTNTSLGERCFCSTCNNQKAQGCSADSDCPVSGACAAGVNVNAPCTADAECPGSFCGTPCANDAQCAAGNICLGGYCSTIAGQCRGRRCTAGGFAGAPCSSDATCGTGSCSNLVGRATKPNRCVGTCDGAAAIGECTGGPSVAHCSVSTTVPCSTDANCPLGQTCMAGYAQCWNDNGVVGASLSTEIVPATSADEASFGAFFCVGTIDGGLVVDENLGTPGPARLRLYTDVTLHD